MESYSANNKEYEVGISILGIVGIMLCILYLAFASCQNRSASQPTPTALEATQWAEL